MTKEFPILPVLCPVFILDSSAKGKSRPSNPKRPGRQGEAMRALMEERESTEGRMGRVHPMVQLHGEDCPAGKVVFLFLCAT